MVVIGRVSPQKNQLMAVKIAERLPDIPFTFVGEVYDMEYFEELLEYVVARGIENVTFTGSVSFKDLLSYVHHSKISLITAVNEHFGMTLPETVAGGCIPIAINQAGPSEILENHPSLLFGQIDDAVSKIETYHYRGYHRLEELQKEMEKYDAKVFKKKMLDKLRLCKGWLKSAN